MQGPGMQDGDEQRMTASLLKYLTKNRMHDEYCLKDPGDIELFEEIERIVRELPSSEKNLDVRTLWISIPRGPIEDFGDYEDYKEDYNYEEFVNLWKYEHHMSPWVIWACSAKKKTNRSGIIRGATPVF